MHSRRPGCSRREFQWAGNVKDEHGVVRRRKSGVPSARGFGAVGVEIRGPPAARGFGAVGWKSEFGSSDCLPLFAVDRVKEGWDLLPAVAKQKQFPRKKIETDARISTAVSIYELKRLLGFRCCLTPAIPFRCRSGLHLYDLYGVTIFVFIVVA